MISAQIETLENARFEEWREDWPEPALYVEVNGRPSRITREKALRIDGRYAALAYNKFQDFYVIIPPELHSPGNTDAGPIKLHGYTSDPLYVALVWKFVNAVDGDGAFPLGPVEIPIP